MHQNIKKYNDRTYIKTSKGIITYGEFGREVASWQNHLLNLGIKKGDRVGIISEKNSEQLKAFYAIWSIGGVAVPVNESLGREETEFIIGDSSPALILTSRKFYSKVSDIFSRVLTFDRMGEESIEEDLSKTDISPNELAALIYTSGSTGNPKGVMLTHGNLVVNGRSAIDFVDICKTDSFYSLLPFWHAFALTVEVVIPMETGASVCFAVGQRDFVKNIPAFEPSILLVVPRILEIMKGGILKKVTGSGKASHLLFDRAHKITSHMEGFSKPVRSLVEKPLQKLIFSRVKDTFGKNFRFFISGGAPLDMGLQTFFSNMDIPVLQGYGLSETSPIVSVDNPNRITRGSVGPLLDWMTPERGGDFAFLSDKGEISRDIEGELLVKGDCVMAGYWNFQDATAKEIENGWLHTGDVGYLDKDGKLHIKGRRSNMIVLAGGEKVHPEHIEDVLKKSHYIDDVMVMGEKCKNLYACVTVPEEYAGHCPTTLKEDIWREIKKHTLHLASYQKPKDFIILPNFTPENGTYTGTMKIRRHTIKKLHRKEIRSLLKSVGEEKETA